MKSVMNLTTLFFLLLMNVASANQENLALEVTGLKADIEQVFHATGNGELTRMLREQAKGGLDLTALRAAVFAETGGLPEKIKVPVHPQAVAKVDYANRMLRQSGVDFYEFEAEIDATLAPPEQPLASDAKAHRRWKVTRTIVLPILGFAATAAEAGFTGLSNIPAASLARAFAVFGLELQFSLFSQRWVKLWRKDQPLIGGRIPLLRAAEASRLRTKLNGLIGLLNSSLDRVSFITKAHAWSYVVNWGYTLTLYGAGIVGNMIAGDHNASFDIVQLLADSWLLNTAFYLSFGMSQIALANLATRGEISELLRFQVETVCLKWNSVWRMVSLVPGLSTLGLAMQLGFGAAVSGPLLLKLAGANAYAQETARLFAANAAGDAEVESVRATRCQRALASVYEHLPLRTGESVRGAARRLGRTVRQWISGAKTASFYRPSNRCNRCDPGASFAAIFAADVIAVS